MTQQSYEILITFTSDKPTTAETIKAVVERQLNLPEGSKVRVTEMWPGALK
ncbi:MAG: hypothetical protein Unbinned3696contig1008_39 [Prokaryotic dsDNA virus sp.]|nr:MAG: hypothetical protein Unbinned3696contig1008_39 [Prokaryotic dsDNA virus sp.]|tara:strand:+ start:4792 stop:4944 length:153 start_codon:yes stop_codon:yes gene_type:complete